MPGALALAQDGDFDPYWIHPDQPYVKIDVVEDGIYRISEEDLAAAGVSPAEVDPATFSLVENGRSIPIYVDNASTNSFADSDALYFVGTRNRGDDEAWAYNYETQNQSSTYRSLYSDTTHYWLTWGGEPGPRYEEASASGSGDSVGILRDTVRLEEDRTYYYGDSQTEAGSPIFSRGEGYYWHEFNHRSGTDPISETFELPVDRKIDDAGAFDVRVRLSGMTNSRHRVTLEIETASNGYVEIDEVDWNGYAFQTLSGSISQADLPQGDVEIRVTSHNEFGASPNRVLLDWVEASYDRHLEASAEAQSFSVASAGSYTFSLSGYQADPILAVNTTDHRYFWLDDGASPEFSDSPSGPAEYWAASQAGMLNPEDISRIDVTDWASTANHADYVILTTQYLRESANALAEYRSSHNDFDVAIVELQDVYNQFDYGRPTPKAIRRFVHRTQSWDNPPQFLAIWADAVFPVRTARQHEDDAPWNVPAFGFSPSDPWYGMQFNGLDDWSEVLSIGRLPIQSNSQGDIILQKIVDYESAELQDWQKRSLLLSGGTSSSERRRLLAYSQDWGDVAANPPMGADTLYFSKQSDDALDTSFQNRLRSAFRDGAGWLNYFGHSAAQSWEIVTDPPGDFDNAGRLPFVVSLGCQTGAFAGGRFDEGMSYGEQLLLGIDGSGNPSMHGAIAHFGTSYLGSISASATINNHLIEQVFAQKQQVAGIAIREAKAEIAARGAQSTLMRDHLLQYGLLGDPALTLALPDKPDLHLSSENISASPAHPLPNDTLQVTVRLENRGTVPEEEIHLNLDHTPPVGESARHERTFEPFPLQKTASFPFPLGSDAVGQHQFRAEVDPEQIIEEVRTDNNIAERAVTVFARGVQLVSPFDRAIVGSRAPELRLAIVGIEEDTPLHLQLASDSSFSSIVDESMQTTSSMLVSWQPDGQLQDGETYFWRARIDEEDDEDMWQTAAFTVRTGIDQAGWLQQGDLFSENEFHALSYESEEGWNFAEFSREILASSERGFGALKGQFNVDGEETYERLNLGFGLLLVDGATGDVIDSGSFCTYEVGDPSHRESGCSGNVDGSEAVTLLEDFLDQAGEGDHIFVRTRHLDRSSTPVIEQQVRDLFRTLNTGSGTYSQAIDTLSYRDLWVMQAEVGAPDRATEVVDPDGSGEQEISIRHDLTFSREEGYVVTPPIGPVTRWGRLHWSLESDEHGSTEVDVLSADRSVLIEGTDGPDADHHLSTIGAAEHRFVRLRARMESADAVAPQLDSWFITFDPTAELAIDRQRIELSADTVIAGQALQVSAPIANITETAASAVEVVFEVTDETNRTQVVARDTLQNLAGDSEAWSEQSIPTSTFSGHSVLTVRANQPGITQRLRTLNTTSAPFFVVGDGGPSNVRVLVEGRELPHDPEPVTNVQDPRFPFVSALPSIEIEIDDLDAGHRLADAGRVGVYLDCDPTGADLGCRSVPSADTTFVPASSAEESARVYYEPDLTGRDTTHTLRLLVEDREGNPITTADSDLTYQLHFRVQSELEVRDLYPYPNPMVSHTQFAFRIRGGDVGTIDDFRIRIYTLAGQLIRELDILYDLSHQDWNAVEWDGTDETGQPVATGVYLYQVFLRTIDGPVDVNDGEVEKVVVIR